MNVIVNGCGRMGQESARMLSAAGHNVTVIDADPKALANLGPDFQGRKVQGVGFDRSVLIQAGIETADAFAATSPTDNANIIAARIAREIFRVPRVVARLYDPRRAEIYQRLGLVTISMIHWGAERIVELLTHTNMDPILALGKGEVILTSIEIPPLLEGRKVSDLQIPGQINVIAVVRNGEAMMTMAGTPFCHGDFVYLSVYSTAVSQLEAMLGL